MAEEMKKAEPARFADRGIVIRRDFTVQADKVKYPHANGGQYTKSQVIPDPTDAERAFVGINWAETLAKKEVK